MFTVFVLQGCATPYQKSGLRGGYSETRLDENVFKVSFNGNANTGGNRVYDFTLLRSAELALRHEYKYFVIVDSNSYKTYGTYTTPITANTNTSAKSFGNRTTSSAITTISGGQTYVYVRPGLSNLIICYKEKPGEVFSYDANFIYKNITEKYNIS